MRVSWGDEMSSMSAGPRLTDEALMARVQSDDVVAFAELYGRHADNAMEVASDICDDRGMAEDAVQEGFFGVWRSRAAFRPELGTFEAWSMRIVHNRAVDSCRAVRGRTPLGTGRVPSPSTGEVDPDPPLTEAISSSERSRLLVALGRLPRVQAEVLLLGFYGGLSHSEIAARIGVPAGTVKGRVRSGLAKLRYELLFADPRNGRE